MKKIVLAMGMGAVLFFSGCAGDTALIIKNIMLIQMYKQVI